MKLLCRSELQSLSMLYAVISTLAIVGNGFAQSSAGQGRSAEERVTIEPYQGPPIFLDEQEQIAPPRVVERKVDAEKYKDSDQVRIEREVIRYSDNHFEADGAYREYYPNGKLFVEGTFAKGRQNGPWTYYHQNGEVNRKAIFKDGQPEGAWEVHRADGTRAARREFVGGQRDGEWIVYDASGEKPIREEHYAKGKPHGVWKSWFPDGNLKQEAGFKDGAKHGPSKEWDENGEVRADVTYVDGKLDGTATIVLPDGRKVVQRYETGRLVSEQRQ